MEKLVEKQANDLHECSLELSQERQKHAQLQNRVVALQTDLQAAELERQEVEDSLQKQWQSQFLELQKQVLRTVTELNFVKEQEVQEAQAIREVTKAMKQHSADQLEQRHLLTELKETVARDAQVVEYGSYYDEPEDECRVLATIQPPKESRKIPGQILEGFLQ